MEIEQIWSRIDGWLERNAPNILTSTPKGISEAEIVNAEKILGRTIPSAVKVSLFKHDGGTTIGDNLKLLPLFGRVSILSFSKLLTKQYGKSRRSDFLPFAVQDLGGWDFDDRNYHEYCVSLVDPVLDKLLTWQYRVELKPEGDWIFQESWETLAVSYIEILGRLADELENNVFVVDSRSGELRPKKILEAEATEAAEAEARENFNPPDRIIARVFPAKLVWDDEGKWWRGRFKHNADSIRLSLVPYYSASFEMKPFVAKMHAVFEKLITSDQEFRQAAADYLLDDYNGEWRKRGPSLTSEEFQRQLKLTAIVIYEDGSATAYYACGKLFQGHDIEIRVDSAGIVNEVCLVG